MLLFEYVVFQVVVVLSGAPCMCGVPPCGPLDSVRSAGSALCSSRRHVRLLHNYGMSEFWLVSVFGGGHTADTCCRVEACSGICIFFRQFFRQGCTNCEEGGLD